MKHFTEKLKNASCNNELDYFASIRYSFDINIRFEDEDNDTLLLYSISDTKSYIYPMLIDWGADYKLTNDFNEGVIHAIVYSGDLKRLQYVLSNCKDIDINLQSTEGVTPLLLSLSLDKFDIASYLISIGADVLLSDESDVSPLHIAIQTDQFQIVEQLIQNGANKLQKTKKGNTPLALAANNGNDEIVKLIFYSIYGYEK